MDVVDTLIIGAGAGGLGAAVWLENLGVDYQIFDAAPELPKNMHNGVHYLHSIPELPYSADIKTITLTDGILCACGCGKTRDKATLIDALEYSEKVREMQHPSSIMEVSKHQTAYLPSTNTLNSMMSEMHSQTDKSCYNWGMFLTELNPSTKCALFKDKDGNERKINYRNCISTVPLKHIQKSFGYELELKSNPIYVTNYDVERIVPNWLINLYVPNPEVAMYRVSILNGIASVESTRDLTEQEINMQIPSVLSMFHLKSSMETGALRYSAKPFKWETGKVVSISYDCRRELVDKMHAHSFYSIGRFGLWNRKLLVDSTINQAANVARYISGDTSIDIIKLLSK